MKVRSWRIVRGRNCVLVGSRYNSKFNNLTPIEWPCSLSLYECQFMLYGPGGEKREEGRGQRAQAYRFSRS